MALGNILINLTVVGSRFQWEAGNRSILMGSDSFSTRLLGSLCLPCYVREAKKNKEMLVVSIEYFVYRFFSPPPFVMGKDTKIHKILNATFPCYQIEEIKI